MSTQLVTSEAASLMEQVIVKGDLKSLTPEQRSSYYMKVCESVGINPLTKPFEYIVLNGKMVLYALRTCTDQLRAVHKVSVEDLTETEREGVFIVTAKVKNGEGRTDIAKGAVTIKGLAGEALANALMKAETKAKRRATLSICGLGMLDETEVETIPGAHVMKDITPAEYDSTKPRSPFKNAALRNTHQANALAALEKAETVIELNETYKLYQPRIDEMKGSADERDQLSAEEIYKAYQRVLTTIKQQRSPEPVDEEPTFDEDEIPPYLRNGH